MKSTLTSNMGNTVLFPQSSLNNQSPRLMKEDRERLKETYRSMNTDELLKLHAAGTLMADAYEVLESVLKGRSVPVPARPVKQNLNNAKKSETKRHCALWAASFSAIGVVIPIVCLVLEFQPTGLMKFCELCWPSGFLLLAMGAHFSLPIVLISITLNLLIWAGIGWLIGYGTSNRIKK